MASPVAIPPDTHIGLDTYTLLVEAFINGSRLSQVLSFFDPTGGLPVAPAADDRYISSATANTWIANYIYYWDGDDVGWVQIIPTTGEITYVVAGPTFPATAILWNGATWSSFGGPGTGDVLGPGASTVNAIVRWGNIAGTVIANSTVLVTNAGDIQIPAGGCLQINALDTACRDANNNLLYGNANLAAITTGTTNTAIGDGVGATLTTGTGNILMGTGTNVTTGADSNAVGIGNGVITNDNSVVMGNAASAASPGTTVMGFNASAAAASAGGTAVGVNASSSAPNGVAMGNGASAGGIDSVAIGSGSTTTGIQSLALGNNANATGISSTAIGDGASATVNNTIVLGTNNETVVIPGSLAMPTLAVPLNTTDVFNVTNIAGIPTGSPTNPGSFIYNIVEQNLYLWNGTIWESYSPSNRKSYESISIAGAGNNPSLAVTTTFVTTTAAASGTLANGTAIGQIKYIAISAYAGNYVMTVTNGLGANGAPITTITYTSAGQGSTQTWDGTNWLILNSGAVVT